MHQVVTSPIPETPAQSLHSATRAESRRLRYACYFALIAALAFFAVIRFRLRTMPLERDEGEYAYMGQQLLHGIPPYKLAANMKLPGTYIAYALIMAIFGETAAGIHLGMILVTTAASFFVFLLGKRLHGSLCGAVAGITYVFFAARPAVLGIDGHATHFVVLAAIPGILFLLDAIDTGKLILFFLSGVAFGLSFLAKQPGILFAFFAGFYLLWRDWKHASLNKLFFTRAGTLVLGTLVPYLLTCVWLLYVGVFHTFWFWTWTYARAYGELNSLATGWKFFGFSFPWAIRPFVLWEIVLLGLAAPLWSRSARAHGGFIASLFFFSAVAVFPGLYFRPHYYIVLLPAAALCAGVAIECARRELQSFRAGRFALVPALYFAIVYMVSVHGQYHSFFRYGPIPLSRKIHYDQPYADAVSIADFIHAHAAPGDQIGIIGSEPEICFYTRLQCTSSYLYMYPLLEKHRFAPAMQEQVKQELTTTRPRWLVYVDDERSWGWKPNLIRNRGFFDWGWDFAHQGYSLVDQVNAPDIGPYPEHLFGTRAALYLFERDK